MIRDIQRSFLVLLLSLIIMKDKDIHQRQYHSVTCMTLHDNFVTFDSIVLFRRYRFALFCPGLSASKYKFPRIVERIMWLIQSELLTSSPTGNGGSVLGDGIGISFSFIFVFCVTKCTNSDVLNIIPSVGDNSLKTALAFGR